ncbi:histidine kinase [Planococcus sp. APC 4015]|nr:histidine kinase [Planococcus sp. APC 4015]
MGRSSHTARLEVIITASPASPPARLHPPGWAVDVLLGLPVALGALARDPFSDDPAPTTVWPMLALGVAVAIVLPLSRRHPLVLLVVTTVIAALAPMWSTTNLGFVLASAICLYRLAATTPDRRWALFAFAGSAALLVAGVVLAGPSDRYLAWMLQPVAILLGATALGEATRSRRAYIDAITERAERAERTRELEAERRVTEERLRIARELHDAAGHQIAAINLTAGVAKNALPGDPDRATEMLTGIQQSARAVLGEISALLQLLRGSPGDAETGALAPVATWDNVAVVVEDFRRLGLEVSGELPRDVPGLFGAADVVAYRVVQEGLANALKHGDGRVLVTADVDPSTLALRIENLVGSQRDPAPSGHYGLIGIQERVDSVSGTVVHRREARRDGTAFVLDVRLPLISDAVPR